MRDERISNDLPYSELVVDKRNVGRPKLRYMDVCKHDLKRLNVDIDEWKKHTDNRKKWHSLVSKRLREREKNFFRTPKKKKKASGLFYLFWFFLLVIYSIYFFYLAEFNVCCLCLFCIVVCIKSCGTSTYGRFRLIAGHNN